ncbi:hypothetical protein [Noviherbaspirillum autotrophicum]|uniref:hypothetical protein n=1 Tax=Noviherbaspirillum autotrophicum TaxID=709839 RepID=UPI0018DFEFF9|nr:hypothetical protein [Noviherbaspirillum autotrophicum]
MAATILKTIFMPQAPPYWGSAKNESGRDEITGYSRQFLFFNNNRMTRETEIVRETKFR